MIRSLSLVGFDLIPIVASETVARRHDRKLRPVPLDGEACASDLRDQPGIGGRLPSIRTHGDVEGLQEPLVAKHALPTEALALDPGAMAEARRALGIGSQPLFWSWVPRAAQEPPRRPRGGRATWKREMFQLLFIGGSGWKTEEFDEFVARLMSLGRPIAVRKRSTEEELWAAYGSARFSVFPSLVEGFGLPVAESLAVGTPAVTSAHGSMAEIAEGGGCLVVDPRDVDAVETAMSRLLLDDRLLERLQTEASSRPARTWDDYAGELWSFLVGSGLP